MNREPRATPHAGGDQKTRESGVGAEKCDSDGGPSGPGPGPGSGPGPATGRETDAARCGGGLIGVLAK